MSKISHATRFGTSSSLADLLGLLPRSKNVAFRRAVEEFLHPAIQRLANCTEYGDLDISMLGKCWIAISRFTISLFVPDTPIDPAAIQQCALELWKYEEATLQTQIELQMQLELRTTGNSDNTIIEYLQAKLADIRQHLIQLASGPLHTRKDITRLHAFWSEIFQFQTQVISASKIDSVQLLLDGGDGSALMREQVIQQSIAGFCQRMESAYPDFEDIRNPFELALLYMRLGLRLVAQSSTGGVHTELGSLRQLSNALVVFPSVRSAAALSKWTKTSESLSTTPFLHPLLSLSSIGLEKSLGVDITDHIHELETTYEQAFRLWSIDRAREEHKDQESHSLYRRKTLDHDAADDAEVEEREFLELFPAFEDVMQENVDAPSLSGIKTSCLVEPSQIQLLVALHLSLLDANTDTPSTAHRIYDDIKATALKTLMESQMKYLPVTLDNQSLSLQFRLLHNRLVGLQSGYSPKKKSYNFYLDANVQEVKKATAVVEALRDRLEMLIREWPDQMVLQHLKDRCDAVLSLDFNSSVAKTLSALEQLLMQTQNWEIYANRENTLKLHQQSMTSLIVEWRQLELSCWQGLLRAQAQSFADGASDSWFHLYDISVRGPLNAHNEGSKENPGTLANYLSQFTPLLDDFIRSSPIGQFQSRMRLLESFSLYTGLLASSKSGPQRSTLERVQRLMCATTRYYASFSPQILTSLSEQRVALEQEIQAFIKLASWKDVNVHALKQSAQRTHHHLYKVVRKFRDVMRQSSADHLRPIFAGDAECKHVTMVSAFSADVKYSGFLALPLTGTRSSAPHLADLDITYQKFNSFIMRRISPSIELHSAQVLDDLAVEIIATARTLASQSVTGGASVSKREKEKKALLVRKRKAWSDLLKELKRAGFSSNVKPDVLHQQSDPLWIREQPILPDFLIPAEKVDIYFDRLHASLPELRSSLSDHHSDITTRELQRGVMLLESGFTFALEARSRYVIQY